MILHVIKSNIYSGAENVVCQIIQGLPSEDFVYMSPRGPIEEKLSSMGLSNFYRGIDDLNGDEIKKAVAELHPTVVHAHDFTASVLCALALKGSVPVVSHLHNNPPWIKGFNAKTLSYLFASRYISQILMVSDSVKDEYRFSNKIKCPMTVVGNPFSVSSIRENAVSDAPHSDILFVGRLVEQKNPFEIIEAALLLKKNCPTLFENSDFKIRLVGDGELKASLQARIDECGLTEYFSLEGFVPNPYAYMNNSKLLIMPSSWEGFGLVALEGMALSKPVVCSGNGGLGDIINDSCGYICHSAAEYTTALEALLTDAALYEKKSAGAIKRAMEYDNIKEYCEKLDSIYKGVSND